MDKQETRQPTQAELQTQFVTEFARNSLGKCYGIHWGDPEKEMWLKPVLHDFLLPAIRRRSRLCEIGSGGGRWSRHLIQSGKPTLLIDGVQSSETIIRAQPITTDWSKVEFLVSPDGNVPNKYYGQYDYVFSFDTFVHFDLDLVLNYLRSISLMLQPGGVLHLHYGDLLSAQWFSKLDDWGSACQSFRYIGREEMIALLPRFGLRMTARKMTFGANGSRLIECVREPII